MKNIKHLLQSSQWFSVNCHIVTKKFAKDRYLELYAENYEPFSVKYWKVGPFGDSL